MADKNYYEILGVDKNATQDEIDKAYRKESRKWHPDMWATKSDEEKKQAEERFKDLNEAKTVLSDKEKRSNYDRFGSAEGGGFDPFSGHNPFRGFGGFNPFDDFNGFKESIDRGDDISIDVEVTMEESFKGGSKNITYTSKKACKHCHGTGGKDGNVETCPHCNGTGVLRHVNSRGGMTMINQTSCYHCGGKGKIVKEKCPHCNGSGYESEVVTSTINIPKGIFDGATVSLQGYGCPPKTGKGINGDLNITFHVKEHEKYKRYENNIFMTLPVTLVEAWEGCKKTIENIDGTKHTIHIQPLTKSGETYKFPNEGFTDPRSHTPWGGQRGSLIVILEYIVPKTLTKEQKKLLEEFYNLESKK